MTTSRIILYSTTALAISLTSPLKGQEVDSIDTENPSVDSVTVTDEDDVNTMSSDEIFRRMFGKDPPPASQGTYIVVIDGINAGEALVEPSDNGWLETEFIQKSVLPLLLSEPAERLRPLLQQSTVRFSELESLGFAVKFDRRDLVLTMVIPFEMRSERIIMLGRRPKANQVDVLQQADYSAYVSVRGGLDWIQKSDNAATGIGGFVADIDSAINFRGVVLEAEFRYDEDSSRRFTRGDVRATYDDQENLIRYEAGDLSIGRRPHQTAPRMAGIAAYREFRIDPYSDPRPVGERGLVLDRAAQVEVLVNGARARIVTLPPGRYSLRDFPIIPGAINDVELIVTYQSGEVERVYFPAFSSIDLLEEGITEFAVNVGVPYEDIDGIRDYDTGEFNLVGFARRGLSSTLTAGVSVEANSDILLVGGEVAWASPIGSIGVTVLNDLQNPGIDSGRLSLQYSWRSKDPLRGTSIDGAVILTGDEFKTLDRLFEDEPTTVYASARISHSFNETTRILLGGLYQSSPERDLDGNRTEIWTASAGLSKSFGRLNVNAGVDYSQGGPRGDELVGRLSLFVPLGRGTLTSSYISRNNSFRADYRRPARQAVGGFGYGAGFQINDDGDQQYARANYIGNRFEAEIIQDRVNSRGDVDIRTGLTFGTALVVADGQFAISRPVQNGFAIVRNGSDIDTRLAVEPRSSPLGGGRAYAAYTDFLGPAVVPDLPSYFVRSIEVEAPDAEAGTGLGGEVFDIRPGYRAGYLLTAGEAGGTVSALGTLQFTDGSPAAMLSGTVERIGAGDDDATKPPSKLFFTNTTGRFFVEGLDPGAEYEVLLMVNGNPERFVLTAPSDAFGIWRIENPIIIEGEGHASE